MVSSFPNDRLKTIKTLDAIAAAITQTSGGVGVVGSNPATPTIFSGVS